MKSGDLLYSPCVNVIRILSPKCIILGGGVDTQRVFGSGTPDEVRADTRKQIEDLAPGGGFVFATVHNIQGNVPPENIMAMWETLQEYG